MARHWENGNRGREEAEGVRKEKLNSRREDERSGKWGQNLMSQKLEMRARMMTLSQNKEQQMHQTSTTFEWSLALFYEFILTQENKRSLVIKALMKMILFC